MTNYETTGNVSDRDFQLDCLRTNLAELTYWGYPDFNERLHASNFTLERNSYSRLILPQGPWTVDTHHNRTDTENVPTLDEQTKLASEGYELDDSGRPIHPWFYNMIDDPQIGVVTGKGAYWDWGPNYTADPIIIAEGHVLLIQRADTDAWALPGGFIDKLETGTEEAEVAAIREAREETGVELPTDTKRQVIYKGVVADIRTTANAWADTTAILFELDKMIEPGKPIDPKEIKDICWLPVNTVTDTHLFGSHTLLLRKAIEAQINS